MITVDGLITAGYNYIYTVETIGGKCYTHQYPSMLMTNFPVPLSPCISPRKFPENFPFELFKKAEKRWLAQHAKENIFSLGCYVFGFQLLGHGSKEKRFVDLRKKFV